MSNINELVKLYLENDHFFRQNIRPGLKVNIELKKDQKSGKKTSGIVKDILTKKDRHTRGIKVRLSDGSVGRVKDIFH